VCAKSNLFVVTTEKGELVMAKKKAVKKTARVLVKKETVTELKKERDGWKKANGILAEQVNALRHDLSCEHDCVRVLEVGAKSSVRQIGALSDNLVKARENAMQMKRDYEQQIEGLKKAIAVLGGRDSSLFLNSLEQMCERILKHSDTETE
jgi:hypothetical protein